jgi:hypothetical protein
MEAGRAAMGMADFSWMSALHFALSADGVA